MERFIISRDDAPDLRFSGELVAERSTRTLRGEGQNKWVVLSLYRTAKGRLVAARTTCSNWQGSRDRYEAAIVDTDAQIQKFFGWSDAAKQLYADAGIAACIEVE
jgi:hypothetical protein